MSASYDDRIALYLGSPSDRPPPIQAAIEAESMPRADTMPPIQADVAVVEAKSLPDADEIPDQRHSPVSGIVEPLAPLASEGDDAIGDADLFRVFDEELQKQVPWSPSNQRGSLP